MLAAGAHADPAKELRIGYQKSASLFVLQKAQGTLEKRLAPQGVAVKWVEFPAGPQLLEGLNVGAIDVGFVGEAPPIFAQAAGARFVYVGNDPASPTTEAIVVPKDSPLKTVADLKGKRIALNKGSNVHYLLVKLLEKNGLKYADVTPVFLRARRCARRVREGRGRRLGRSGIRSWPRPSARPTRARSPTAPASSTATATTWRRPTSRRPTRT